MNILELARECYVADKQAVHYGLEVPANDLERADLDKYQRLEPETKEQFLKRIRS